jgi:hypothetical protein
MPFFAIRHKCTGYIIPCANGRLGRGGSHVEPIDPRENLPRIFTEKRYAKGWLTSWCKGKIVKSGYTSSYDGEYEESQKTIPTPHRKRKEYEICPVYIRFGKPVMET